MWFTGSRGLTEITFIILTDTDNSEQWIDLNIQYTVKSSVLNQMLDRK